jgi:serine/threonine protein phosphatase PrpC
MKYISILEQPTKEAIRVFAEKRNLTEHLPEIYQHPQEDYLIASNSPPVFVVADGVTLDFKRLIECNKKYPNPSPAGEVAKIFCEAVIKNATEKYDELDALQIVGIFKDANSEVKKYNERVGKSDISGNITGFYAATGSFVIIKDNRAYWASICDAFVAHFDKDMNVKFISTGLCSPYAVINGEERMAEHLEKGVFDLDSGDRIFVFTDGFEHYVRNNDFLEIFKNWDNSLEKRIAEFSKLMNLKDPENYGHERSLIAILV